MVRVSRLEAVQKRLRELVNQKSAIEQEIGDCLRVQTEIALGSYLGSETQTPTTHQQQDLVLRTELATTLKERLILALGRVENRYLSIEEVAKATQESPERVRTGLRDLRAKYQLLEAPVSNTWKLNDKGRAEYKKLVARYTTPP